MHSNSPPGRLALLLAMADEPEQFARDLGNTGYRLCTGRAGSTDVKRILASIETACLREGVVSETTAEMHALYHAAYDCMTGLLRGDLTLGSLMRTVGLKFAVVRSTDPDGHAWIAVAVYGTIGSLMKGKEHEAAGLGICHV